MKCVYPLEILVDRTTRRAVRAIIATVVLVV